MSSDLQAIDPVSLSAPLCPSTYVVPSPRLVPTHISGMGSMSSWTAGGGALCVHWGCQGQS